MSRTQRQITMAMYNALTDISEQLNNALDNSDISDAKLMRSSGVSKPAFVNLKHDKGYVSNLSTVIALFDALGYDEITIRWR